MVAGLGRHVHRRCRGSVREWRLGQLRELVISRLARALSLAGRPTRPRRTLTELRREQIGGYQMAIAAKAMGKPLYGQSSLWPERE